jgi:hypothetical protein
MLLFLVLFGVVEVVLLKKMVSIIENSFLTGGRVNGKQLLNSHRKEPYLITLLIILNLIAKIHVNLKSGIKY